MQLDKERKYFESHKDDYLTKYRGQYILIKGDEFAGSYPDAHAAYLAGLQKYGVEPFLVRQVLEEEPAGFVPMMSHVRHAGL